jgi:hypothetical protein
VIERCVVLKAKSGIERAYVFPDADSAAAWYELFVGGRRHGGAIVFHTPTDDGRLFVTAYGSDDVADIHLASVDVVVRSGMVHFAAVLPDVPCRSRAVASHSAREGPKKEPGTRRLGTARPTPEGG